MIERLVGCDPTNSSFKLQGQSGMIHTGDSLHMVRSEIRKKRLISELWVS